MIDEYALLLFIDPVDNPEIADPEPPVTPPFTSHRLTTANGARILRELPKPFLQARLLMCRQAFHVARSSAMDDNPIHRPQRSAKST